MMINLTLHNAVEIAKRHSRYVSDILDRKPDLIGESDLAILDCPALLAECKIIAAIADERDFQQALRLIRHRHMVRIAVRDMAGLSTLAETLADTSMVADNLIRTAYDWAYAKLTNVWGNPIGESSGQPQDMVVLAMGKLGGQELNFSSDIDLIFAFPESGETVGGERSLSNEEFFIRLGRLMNSTLTTVTEWGFVYRVDMQLRPFGSAGPLAQSFNGLDRYYQNNGRPWERHAMVKARAITGSVAHMAQLQDIITPFVYRPYVDFSMLNTLRDLKRLIAQDLKRNGNPKDLKLGVGGIRDIEFIVQSFQLVHGGRDVLLRGRSLMPMLQALGERNYLDSAVADELTQAYSFLRQVENRVQMYQDHREHCLPRDPVQLEDLAQGLGFPNSTEFQSRLDGLRKQVASHFDAVFREDDPPVATGWEQVWADPRGGRLPKALSDEKQWREHLAAFRKSSKFQNQTAEARERLDAVIHLLLAEIPDVQTLSRVLQVLDSVLRRSVYLVLLKASPSARQSLIELCAASPWLADTLASTPALLDQMLDSRHLFALPSRSDLVADMQAQLGNNLDDEFLMNVIRQTKHANVFKVAANDLINHLPLMKVSDNLTWTAEAIVEVALDQLWKMARLRHGNPGGWTQDQPPFAVIGFGKLGGLEMGYGSDLDMVFLCHDDLSTMMMSDGPHQLEGAIYMTRLGQQLIRTLSTAMVSGIAYQVDSRLRPHGVSGILINSLSGFFAYEQSQAWVWEHQALIRTRAIAGHPQMRKHFERMRTDFLCQPRDPEVLRTEVVKMRQKMRIHLDKSTADVFDLKQGSGGIIDLEFLIQYLILTHAHTYPQIATFSDNMRQIQSLNAAGILSAQEQQDLSQAYLALRGMAHKAALAKKDAMILVDQVQQWRHLIRSAWDKFMAS